MAGVVWWRFPGSRPGSELFLSLPLLLCLMTHVITGADVKPMTSSTFHFTQEVYHGSIKENAVGKTYVTPSIKMGIYLSDPSFNVRYKVVDGDEDGLFKADERIIGDFCFLRLRLRTGSHSVINRERRDSYKIGVKARGDYGHNGSKYTTYTEIVISVLDENDLSPIFFERSYEKQIPETTSLHAVIARVEASDADIGVNGEIYYSFAEKTEMFTIHPTSGVVYLTRPLTYSEDKNIYELEVLANDRGPAAWGFHYPSRATLKVEVTKVNFHAPEIKLQELPSVIEHGEINSVYAILYVHDSDIGVSGEINSVRITEGNDDGYFRLKQGKSPTEYNIEIARQLDRELDPYGFNLTIEATDRGYPQRTTTKYIHVRLQDTNDQTPQFEHLQYNVTVDECVPISTPLVFVQATDQDFSKNAEIRYKISHGNENGWFKVNPVSGLISVARGLDAENSTMVHLMVDAEDQGNLGSRRRSYTDVYIHVGDCNDNAPIFMHESPLEVDIEEGKPVGSLVFQVNAYDRDKDANGTVSYSITNIEGLPFVIDPFNGRITTKELLDYEYMQRTYKLLVRASDRGTPFRRETEMVMTVNLRDVNDNKPQFEKVNCKGYLSRDAPIGTSLLVVPAIDFEVTNIISYSIVSGNEDNCFEVIASNGELRTKCNLRRTNQETYSVGITATDGLNEADPTKVNITLVNSRSRLLGSTYAQIMCQDTDVHSELSRIMSQAIANNAAVAANDPAKHMNTRYTQNAHVPRFPSALPGSIEVIEGWPQDKVIINLQAEDEDQGYNGKLLYTISSGNVGDVFKVDIFTGELLVLSEIDREERDKYTLNITATDMGVPSKSTFKILEVYVDDMNDNAPVFEKEEYQVVVREDRPANSSILQVLATDADSGINAQILYSILTDTKNFTINPTTGEISMYGSLDREYRAEYELRVQAANRDPNTLMTAVTKVKIRVDDINDNYPRFQFDQYNIQVREDLPVGTVVMMINAEDLDDGNGGEVRYSLLDGSDGKFEVDRLTGTIRIAEELDFETKQVYNITARAKDKGEPSLSSKCDIVIEVVDVNENLFPPTFPDFVYQGRVKENEPVNTIVLQLIAIDYDAKKNNLASPKDYDIVYSIQNGSGLGLFTIDSRGNIRTTEILDRETQSYYWLTIFAQDRGTVPLSSMVEVLIEIEDVNDNVPQTIEPVYYSGVMENSPEGTTVVKLEATDLDDVRNNRITYEITSGNPQGFFTINRMTGMITTTKRKLDREAQEEHILEVNCSDSGVPKQSSTTRVVITVVDINDNVPEFTEFIYRARIPEMVSASYEVPLYRVVAFDRDKGPNAQITYSLREDNDDDSDSNRARVEAGVAGIFTIHPQTGVIMSRREFSPGQQFDITVVAKDNGRPQRESEATVRFRVVSRPSESPNPPVFTTSAVESSIMENDVVGQMVTLMSADDLDNDKLWYSIIAGNHDDMFSINTEGGNIILAGHLDWETVPEYNLTIQASDGYNNVHTWVHIQVLDINDNRPQFDKPLYKVEVQENTPKATEILTVTARDADKDRRLFYTIHSAVERSSLGKFRINSETGVITTLEPLDREVMTQHALTIMVRDQGHPSKRSFARVLITMADNNDHTPRFLASVFEGRVFRTAPVGTAAVTVLAADRDTGRNAVIKYSIVSGNAGAAFDMNSNLGIISVATDLDKIDQSEYNLVVKATDGGSPSLASTASVVIHVTVSDNAPPKFLMNEYTAELDENSPKNAHVAVVNAKSRSSVVYDIISGNDDDFFAMVPNAGIVYTMFPVDYELNKFFNLTIKGTNMAGAMTRTNLVIHVRDMNDNPPVFIQELYIGNISEEATPGSVVLTENNTEPLVIKAEDLDSGDNALLLYSILEEDAQDVFDIDSSTGAIKTKVKVDHELASSYEFTVQVTDSGQPRQSADIAAKVKVNILDINDSPPVFAQREYFTTLLLSNFRNMDLAAYKDVEVLTLTATDPDLAVNSVLTYEIVSGNEQGHFTIDPDTGAVTVATIGSMLDSYELLVKVNDGKFETTTVAKINVDFTPQEGLGFSQQDYYAEIRENLTGVEYVAAVQATGHELNEHLTFIILNPHDMFEIGSTSGVVKTTGVRAFDRELQDNYTLTVEVRDQKTPPRVAHAMLHVHILDMNDNRPVFVNQPYYAIVSVEAPVGEHVKEVSAIDRDIGPNGQVIFSLLDDGSDKFSIEETTGQISLKRALQSDDQNEEFTLVVQASDKGDPPLRSTAEVSVTIRNEATPIFSELYYSVSVPESVPVHSAVLTIEAQSPRGRKLIYSITDGDVFGEFVVQFETDMDVLGPCSIIVQEELDYELYNSYDLTITATDFQTGAFSTTIVHIDIEDVNDNTPSFDSLHYVHTVSEAIPIGTSVLAVKAKDADTGANAKVHYHLEQHTGGPANMANNPGTNYFHIDTETGIILTKTKLDREVSPMLNFVVVATDSGFPALSSSVQVTVHVTDLNDNPPKFEQPAYEVTITDLAQRGQFVTKVIASDPDDSDVEQLAYRIIGGNSGSTFAMDERTGIISLSTLRTPNFQPSFTLNISVTDGVFTNYATVKVLVEYSNNNVPTFTKSVYDMDVVENAAIGEFISRVTAVDLDVGDYGRVQYDIESEDAEEIFRIEKDTGKLYTKHPLDREEAAFYSFTVVARDGGGRTGHAIVRVNVADQGDHKPQFLMNEYKINIYASHEVGTTALQVRAVDYDLAFNGDIEYSIYDAETSQASEYFEVGAKNGAIMLTKAVVGHENQLFQFFVRARDGGSPPQHSDVPVDIYIMGAEDLPPTFPAEHMGEFFTDEDNLVGSVAAAFKAESNESLVYSIVPGEMPSNNNPAKFTISNTGKITILEPLDRETTERFELTVKAETKTSPPLVAYTKVSIQVRDQNDNSPKFESNPYLVSIVENAEIGSKVVQVVAHDKDIGANADITYEFSSDYVDMSNTFAINRDSGWISTLVTLDREDTDSYTFVVVAKDRGSDVQLTDETSITITVMDHNDEPPVFTEQNYGASVNEDALPGTIIRMVTTHDKDLPPNNKVTYSITEGDPMGHFNIRDTGEIYVNKGLDREKTAVYNLVVAATDGAFVSEANVEMTILDANDNAPVCAEAVYTKSVPENQPLGYIIQVRATDADEQGTPNARLTFSIQDDPDNIFVISEHTGLLSTLRPLDRETTPKYQLKVVVSDGGGLACTSDVYITVVDENDNAPVFSERVYSVQVSEDADVNSLLVRVSASDADTGIHRKVEYSLPDRDDRFKIDAKSGIVSLMKPLDREVQDRYDLMVYAHDMGAPRMTSSASVIVLVLDINDNPPEFERTLYSATVSEALSVGAHVVTVYATSKDTGVNGEITYGIVAGNEQGHFVISADNGVVSVAHPLDYESLREYVLTIEGRDGGTPSLSSTAMVKVNVTDANDNAPVFSQDTYTSEMREDIAVNSLVLQVLATDLDGMQFGRLEYHIAGGDPDRHFDINLQSGYIHVAAQLDREMIPTYDLEIVAVDSGVPQMTGTTTVQLELLDVNDTPPRFTETNYTAVMQEHKQLGFNIIKLEVVDDDLDPNGPPFTFDIIEGNEQNKFYINSAGILSTAATFNRKIKDVYNITVRVFDNGSPPLHSDVVVTVQLVEESAFPPTISELSVKVTAFNDEFSGGILGRVQARDPDPYDEISYSIASDNSHLFEVDAIDGTLKALQSLDAGVYQVTIGVTDGKFITKKNVTVAVNNIDSDMASNSVIMTFSSLSAEEFVKKYQESFILSTASELGVKENYIHVLSVQPSSSGVDKMRRKRATDEDLDVLVAVKKSDVKFYNSKKLRKQLERAESDLEQAMNVEIVGIKNDICTKDTCVNGECATEVLLFPGETITVETERGGSIVFLKHGMTTRCSCSPGYGGPDCVPAVCHENLCPSPRVCVSKGTSYQCVCPEGSSGDNCEIKVAPPCVDNSCQDGATTFRGESYISWSLTIPMERRLSLSLDVRTEQSHARLMHAQGRVDYSYLEIENGMIQYRFDCGGGEGLARVDKLKINDGQWHSVSLQRIGGSVNIVIDDHYHSNEGRLPGKNDVLNLDSSEVYIGAAVDKSPTGYEIVRDGFVGCLRQLKVEGEELKISGGMSVAVLKDIKDVEFGCNLLGICSTNPCLHGGRCVPLSELHYECHCDQRYKGEHCQYDMLPCQSNPCLNGGTCESRPPDNYHCYCLSPYKQPRCQINCEQSPCKNGGRCTRERDEPVCECTRGFTGHLCETDINECHPKNPCQNGGRCTNILGSFKCNCTKGFSGDVCDDMGNANIKSSKLGINQDEIIIIAGVVLGVIILVSIFVFVIYCRRRRKKKRSSRCHQNQLYGADMAETEFIDNIRCKVKNVDEPANNLAMASQRCGNGTNARPPPVPKRPVSYTASTADSMNTLNMCSSNLDSFRDYGSAADELENMTSVREPIQIPEFLTNVDPEKSHIRMLPPVPPEEEPLLKRNINPDNLNFAENYPNDLKKQNKFLPSDRGSTQTTPLLGLHKKQANSGMSLQASEDDLAGYHWDTSDWNPNAAPTVLLPPPKTLNEQPIKEVLDCSPASSAHSNDSNLHVDQVEDYEYNTDYVDDLDVVENDDGNESEYVGDSEYAENELDGIDTDDPDADYPDPPNFQEILALQGQLRFDGDATPGTKYDLHPDQYLPQYNISENNSQVGDDDDEDEYDDYNGNFSADNFARDDEDDVIHYGFPRAGGDPANKKLILGGESAANRYNIDFDNPTSVRDDMSVSMGGYTSTNASCSDISQYGLCDIEDSEANNSDDNEEEHLARLLKPAVNVKNGAGNDKQVHTQV